MKRSAVQSCFQAPFLRGNNLQIIEANFDDAAKLAEFGKELFLEAFSDEYTDSDLADHLEEDYSLERYEHHLSQSNTCLLYAELDRELQGYVLGRPCSLPVDTQGRKSFELRRLYVRKNVKGKGVALRLLYKFIDWAKIRNYERLYAGVWKGNYRDRVFERYGFQLVGGHYFSVGTTTDTDLIFMKELV